MQLDQKKKCSRKRLVPWGKKETHNSNNRKKKELASQQEPESQIITVLKSSKVFLMSKLWINQVLFQLCLPLPRSFLFTQVDLPSHRTGNILQTLSRQGEMHHMLLMIKLCSETGIVSSLRFSSGILHLSGDRFQARKSR